MKCVVVGDVAVGKVCRVLIILLVLSTERACSIDLSSGIIYYEQVSQWMWYSGCKRPLGREFTNLDLLLGLR